MRTSELLRIGQGHRAGRCKDSSITGFMKGLYKQVANSRSRSFRAGTQLLALGPALTQHAVAHQSNTVFCRRTMSATTELTTLCSLCHEPACCMLGPTHYINSNPSWYGVVWHLHHVSSHWANHTEQCCSCVQHRCRASASCSIGQARAFANRGHMLSRRTWFNTSAGMLMRVLCGSSLAELHLPGGDAERPDPRIKSKRMTLPTGLPQSGASFFTARTSFTPSTPSSGPSRRTLRLAGRRTAGLLGLAGSRARVLGLLSPSLSMASAAACIV